MMDLISQILGSQDWQRIQDAEARMKALQPGPPINPLTGVTDAQDAQMQLGMRDGTALQSIMGQAQRGLNSAQGNPYGAMSPQQIQQGMQSRAPDAAAQLQGRLTATGQQYPAMNAMMNQGPGGAPSIQDAHQRILGEMPERSRVQYASELQKMGYPPEQIPALVAKLDTKADNTYITPDGRNTGLVMNEKPDGTIQLVGDRSRLNPQRIEAAQAARKAYEEKDRQRRLAAFKYRQQYQQRKANEQEGMRQQAALMAFANRLPPNQRAGFLAKLMEVRMEGERAMRQDRQRSEDRKDKKDQLTKVAWNDRYNAALRSGYKPAEAKKIADAGAGMGADTSLADIKKPEDPKLAEAKKRADDEQKTAAIRSLIGTGTPDGIHAARNHLVSSGIIKGKDQYDALVKAGVTGEQLKKYATKYGVSGLTKAAGVRPSYRAWSAPGAKQVRQFFFGPD